MVHTFTDENFDNDVLKADRPVLVDFWAQWCGPCQAMTPIIEEITEEYDGKMLIGKMDVDANPETTQKYGIMSIPSIKIFKGGEIIEEMVGALPKNALKTKIEANL